MEPEIQKLAVTALVGLLMLFPVFNQVAATSLDALTDADHKAKWKDFMKDWGDIPEDEKLSYWDGRNKPPGSGDEFDRDRLDDDFRAKNPGDQDPQPTEGDRDGDGVPDEEDVDPDDPEENERRKVRWVTEELWVCPCNGNPEAGWTGSEDIGADGVTYDFVNVTWSWSSFTGSTDFRLLSNGDEIWSERAPDSGGPTAVVESDGNAESVQGIAGAGLSVSGDYQPITRPNSVSIIITGAYKEYVDE